MALGTQKLLRSVVLGVKNKYRHTSNTEYPGNSFLQGKEQGGDQWKKQKLKILLSPRDLKNF